jgi:hypothetical protein
MAAQFVFPGSVDEQARPQIEAEHKPRYRETLRALAGKRIELVLRKPKSKRSIEMNAYLHCETGPFRLLAEHFGEDVTGVKYALMGECFGWVYSEAAKREVPIKAHTSEMTIEESKYFVDWVIPWAAREHGVLIPLPNESI